MMIITAQKGSAMSEADRLELARLLVKMGYTVRVATVRQTGAKQPVKGVEYWAGDNRDEDG